MPDLEKRIRDLERGQRRLRIALVLGALAVIALGVSAGSARRPGRSLEAERFVIRGSEGRYGGELGLSPEGVPVLVLSAKDDSSVARRLPESMGGVYLFDGFGHQQAFYQLGHRGGAELLIGDSLAAVVAAGRFMVYRNGIRTWASPQ